ncbi:MAG: hypothetical protein ABJA71_10965 [Ginsengibacter sp.]
MNYWNKICGFVVIFFLQAFFSTGQIVKNPTLLLPANRQLKSAPAIVLSKNENTNSFFISPVNVITSNYYTQHFGLICKKELALQKAIKLPIYIRLGSLQECNYLEGKR